MGTNYFLAMDDRLVHVCKSFHSWQGYPPIPEFSGWEPEVPWPVRSVADWRTIIPPSAVIIDEYGDRMTGAEFWERTDAVAPEHRGVQHTAVCEHAEQGDLMCRSMLDRGEVWLDPDGWSFDSRPFS